MLFSVLHRKCKVFGLWTVVRTNKDIIIDIFHYLLTDGCKAWQYSQKNKTIANLFILFSSLEDLQFEWIFFC